MMKTKRPAYLLVPGDVFEYQGERATMITYVGEPRSTWNGIYQDAWVRNGDGRAVKWSINQYANLSTF